MDNEICLYVPQNIKQALIPQSDNRILPSTPTVVTRGLADLGSKTSFSFPMFDTSLCMGLSHLQQNDLVVQGPY